MSEVVEGSPVGGSDSISWSRRWYLRPAEGPSTGKSRPVTTVWDLYLDADDAVVLLDAVATLERHRAVREPMPLQDALRLLDRFQIIAGVAEQDAVYWRREADDRREEADADGGRWGTPRIASTMVGTADDLADGARVIATAAYAAAADLAARLEELATPSDASADDDPVGADVVRLIDREGRTDR